MIATLAKALSRAIKTDVDIDALKAIIIFSGIGLLISLIALLTYGLDLSEASF